MSWTLQIGSGSQQTPEALGISAATLTQTRAGDDTLQITIEEPIESQTIAAFERCILRVDGTIRFVGWLDQPPKRISPQREETVYLLNGPMRWLRRAYYLAPSQIDGEEVDAASGKLRLGATQAFVTGTTTAPLDHMLVGDQLAAILDYGKARKSPAVWDYAIAGKDTDFAIEIAFEDRTDDLVETVVRSLLAYIPGAAVRWDYPALIPSGLAVPIMRILDTTGAEAEHTLTEENLAQLPVLNPRYDLLADRLRIFYLATNADGAASRTVETVASGGEAAELGADYEIIYTFSLQEGETAPAPGLGAKLAAWFQKLHVEAQPTFVTLDWDHRPGDMWTFGGVFGAIETSGGTLVLDGSTSLCESVTRDLFLERETIQLGTPAAPSTYRLSKRTAGKNNNNQSQRPEEETGTVAVTITGLAAEDLDGSWLVGNQGGIGNGSVEVAPGSYVVSFNPVIDRTNGLIYFADPKEVTVVKDESETVIGEYIALERLQLRAGDEGSYKYIDLNAADLAAPGTVGVKATAWCDGGSESSVDVLRGDPGEGGA